MLSLHAMAYDFSYTHQGKTLYYNIISDNTVEVTKAGKLTYDTIIEGEQKLPSVYDDTAVFNHSL